MNKHPGIFHEHEAGSNFAKDSGKFTPEPGALALEAAPGPGRGGVLARKPAGDDQLGGVLAQPGERVGGVGVVGAERPHVIPDREPRPSEGEDSAGELLELDGDDGLDSGDPVGEESAAGAGG